MPDHSVGKPDNQRCWAAHNHNIKHDSALLPVTAVLNTTLSAAAAAAAAAAHLPTLLLQHNNGEQLTMMETATCCLSLKMTTRHLTALQ
jgi:hypothetical protein